MRAGIGWWPCLPVLLLSLLQGAACGAGSKDKPPPAPPPPPPLTLGATTPGPTWTVGPGGGVKEVTDGRLAGLRIEVPAGAWDAPVTFRLASTEVVATALDAKVRSPLITFDTGGAGFAREAVRITVPAALAAGEVPLAFAYDRATGALEPLPTLAVPGGVAVLTHHFTDMAVLAQLLQALLGPTPTRFEHGRDDLAVVNQGSYAYPRGHCTGQVLAVLHHFYTRWSPTQGLFSLADNPDRPELRTPLFWEDDRRAIQLAGALQVEADFTGKAYAEWEALQPALDHASTYGLLALSLHASAQPLFLGVFREDKQGGHALLVYGKRPLADGTGMEFLVSDPNHPWTFEDPNERVVTYRYGAGRFDPYQGRTEASAEVKPYTRFLFFGTYAFVDFDLVERLWQRYEEGSLGSYFPAAPLVALEAPTPGSPAGPLQDGMVRTDPRLQTRLGEPWTFTWVLTAYDRKLATLGRASSVLAPGYLPITLAQGDNLLGFEVQAKMRDPDTQQLSDEWVDFRWVNVRYQPPVPGQPVVVGSLELTTGARDVAVRGNTAYLALDVGGLATVDVTSPAAPALLVQAALPVHSSGRGLAVSDDLWAYMGLGAFAIVDVRNPMAPARVSATGFNADCGRVVTWGETAFVACGMYSYQSKGVAGVVDISHPEDPQPSRGLAVLEVAHRVRDVAVTDDGATAWVLDFAGGLTAFDVSDPALPVAVAGGTLAGPGEGWQLVIRGTLAYVAGPSLRVVDIGKRAAPVQVGELKYRDLRALDVAGGVAVGVGDGAEGTGNVWVMDVSNPAAPAAIGNLHIPATPYGVRIVGNRAFVARASASGTGGLTVVGF